MLKTKLGFVLVVLFAALAGCSSNVSIDTDYSEEVDFSSYQTYRWYQPEGDESYKEKHAKSDILDERIRSNVVDQLSLKSMQLKEQGEVDFFVNYSVTSVHEVDVDTYQTYSGYSRNYRWYGGGYGYGYRGGYNRGGVTMSMTGIPSTETEITEYKKGTLLIDIIDSKDDTLVWRGAANGRLPEKEKSKDEKEKAAREIIGNLMENFPP